MATEEQLIEALRRADTAGDTQSATVFAQELGRIRAQPAAPSPGIEDAPSRPAGSPNELASKVLGYPVDTMNMVMSKVGVPTSDKPVGGSKTIQQFLDSLSAREIVEQTAKEAADFATLPGDVYAGRVDPNSDEAIQRAATGAMLIAGAGTQPVRKAVTSAAKAPGKAVEALRYDPITDPVELALAQRIEAQGRNLANTSKGERGTGGSQAAINGAHSELKTEMKADLGALRRTAALEDDPTELYAVLDRIKGKLGNHKTPFTDDDIDAISETFGQFTEGQNLANVMRQRNRLLPMLQPDGIAGGLSQITKEIDVTDPEGGRFGRILTAAGGIPTLGKAPIAGTALNRLVAKPLDNALNRRSKVKRFVESANRAGQRDQVRLPDVPQGVPARQFVSDEYARRQAESKARREAEAQTKKLAAESERAQKIAQKKAEAAQRQEARKVEQAQQRETRQKESREEFEARKKFSSELRMAEHKQILELKTHNKRIMSADKATERNRMVDEITAELDAASREGRAPKLEQWPTYWTDTVRGRRNKGRALVWQDNLGKPENPLQYTADERSLIARKFGEIDNAEANKAKRIELLDELLNSFDDNAKREDVRANLDPFIQVAPLQTPSEKAAAKAAPKPKPEREKSDTEKLADLYKKKKRTLH